MKIFLCGSGLVLALGAIPALADSQSVPAPAIGIGLPVLAAIMLAGLITPLLKRSRA